MIEIETPPKPKPVTREEGQCDWCKFRATDVCGLGHSTKDHCNGMGHRGLKCNDYLWWGSSQEAIDFFIAKRKLRNLFGGLKGCKCVSSKIFDRLYMKLFRWYKDRQFNKWMEEPEKKDQKLLEDWKKMVDKAEDGKIEV